MNLIIRYVLGIASKIHYNHMHTGCNEESQRWMNSIICMIIEKDVHMCRIRKDEKYYENKMLLMFYSYTKNSRVVKICAPGTKISICFSFGIIFSLEISLFLKHIDKKLEIRWDQAILMIKNYENFAVSANWVNSQKSMWIACVKVHARFK